MANYLNKLKKLEVRMIPYYVVVYTQQSVRMLLYYILKFDKWHTLAPVKKPWVKATIKFLDQKEDKGSCVDIACGLGDIIRQVKFDRRLGLDMYNDVLKGARFLSLITIKRRIVFKQFKFPVDSLNEKYDAILLVSLCHVIEPDILKSTITDYYLNNLNNNGCIIIEIVHHFDRKIYPINHDVNFLTESINCKLELIAEYYPKKELWAIINRK